MRHRNWIPNKIDREHKSPRSYIVKTSTRAELRWNLIHPEPDLIQPDKQYNRKVINSTDK